MNKLTEGYKQTEVGVIPSDWEVKKLSDISNMKSGDSITSKRIFEIDSYPCYGGNGLRGYTSKYTHDGDYALIGRQGALCGNVQFVMDKFFASEHAVVVTPKTNTDIKWLYYMLIDMNLNQYSESSAQPGLSVSKILNLPIHLPPAKAEQTAIATALNDADALITQLEKLIAKKRNIKQGAMQELLKPKEGWEEKPLGQIVEFLDGKRRPIKDSDRAKMKGIYPYYGASGIIDFVNNYLFDEELILLGEDGENIISRNQRLAFKINGKAWVNNHAHVIKPKENIDINFLVEKLESINYEEYNSGTAQPKLNQKICVQIPISIPKSKAEQTRIAQILSDMDAEIEALEKKLEKYKMLKQGMMQNLLTGKVRLV